MKINTIQLTRKQLIEAYKRFDGEKWQQNINEIVTNNFLACDNDKIAIEDKYIKLIKDEATKEQKNYVQSLGITLESKHKTVDLKSAFEVLGLRYEPYIEYIIHKNELALKFGLSSKDIIIEQKYFEIEKIFEAINKEANWTPDYLNSTQNKYKPYFMYGSGWVYDCCHYWRTYSYFGSRLCVSTKDDAEYIGELLIKLGYNI